MGKVHGEDQGVVNGLLSGLSLAVLQVLRLDIAPTERYGGGAGGGCGAVAAPLSPAPSPLGAPGITSTRRRRGPGEESGCGTSVRAGGPTEGKWRGGGDGKLARGEPHLEGGEVVGRRAGQVSEEVRARV